MAQQEPVREFSAERTDRLRRSGTVSVDGQPDVRLDDILRVVLELKADVAELRSEVDGLARVGPAGSRENPDGSREDPDGSREGTDGSREGLEARVEIAQMVHLISQAKLEIASIKHPMSDDDRMLAAANELDAIVLATETSTNDILAAAEATEHLVRIISGRFPDDAFTADTAEKVAEEIIKIFEACSFQDITGQRMTKVIKAIKFIEERILAMIEIWGIEAFAELPMPQKDAASGDEALMNGPQLSGAGISQADINALFD